MNNLEKCGFFLKVLLLLFGLFIFVNLFLINPTSQPCCSGYPAYLVCQDECRKNGMNYSHYEGYHTLDYTHSIKDLKCVCDNWKEET
jgi:hypothetical protein